MVFPLDVDAIVYASFALLKDDCEKSADDAAVVCKVKSPNNMELLVFNLR